MKKINKYLSLIKFSHTIFAMPFALVGLFMGVFFLNQKEETGRKGLEVVSEYFSFPCWHFCIRYPLHGICEKRCHGF